ncbi:uncharacterized protein LOC128278549 [Anopheles cruzii]|uniref:uncharacterized protein LOC128278549 n=1 Tax=Anopheles cruzii TaxID=68878 RepID=UPI0022EC6070|nr:uncharacterized protein LOC128278549 [Anopheles cruzii]
MSDSELDRTLVHPEQTQDFVHFGLTTAIDSSVTTILPLVAYHQQHQQHPHELPVASGEPESHYVPYCDVVAGGAHQMQLRHPVAFARHIHSPISHQDDQPKRISTSLPLYYAKSDLCTLGSRPGMEYVPLRTPAAEPYHYHHVTDQTKSLQELQNEVGALLEFRDLVIETFPDLKTKMASSATNSTLTGIPSSSSSLATTRREWEPGIRIRRKLTVQKEPFGGGGGVTNAAASCSIGGSVTNTSSTGSTTGERTVGSGLTSIPPATSATNISSTITGGTGASSSTGIVGATPPTIIHNISSSSTSDLNHPHPQQHHPPHQHSHGSGSGHHQQQQQQQQQQPQQQQQQQHSSSSLIRSRSNSHSGKKEPKSGEGNNGSVIQDSGFSTETSSSKETHSAASSTSGAVQGTGSSTATNRLAVETENELWNLLDVIHRKSSRLRDELDLLPHHVLTERASEKLRPTNLLTSNQHQQQQQQQQYVGGVGGPSAPSSAPSSAASSSQRHHHHLHDSSGSHNIVIHHCNPAEVSAGGGGGGGGTLDVISSAAPVTDAITTGTTPTTVVVAVTGGGEGAGNGPADHGRHHEDPSGGGGGGALALPVVVAAKDHIVQILRNERDRLLEKMAGYEAETVAGRIRTAKMQDEVDTLTLTVRSLHEQLKAAHSQQLELNSKLHDLHHHHQPQPVNRSGTPSSSESIKALIPHQQQGSVSPGEPPAKASRFHAAAPSVENNSSGGSSSTGTTMPKSSAAVAAAGGAGGAVVVDLPATGDSASVAAVRGRPLDVGSLGRLDALLGPPGGGGTLRLQKVRSLDSQKFAAILLETNIVELQRHLLTVTVQNQVLQQRLEQATRSRIFLSAKFEKSKEDVDDLRFQLKEKSIELEGTKAQLRVIESKAAASSSSKSSSSSAAGSPEHHHQQQQQQQHIITVGAHAMLLPSSLHHHHHHQMHQQQHQQHRQSPLLHLNHHHASTMASNSQLAMRLPSSQVSTPSMKAMTPVAMDDIAQQHSSSTESAQDQAERDSSTTTTGGSRQQHQQHQYHNHLQQQQPQCPETPRRRPSKIPLPGMKGSSAPKPPSGRNFSAAVAAAAAATSTTPTTPTMAGAAGGGVRPLAAAASGGSTVSSGPLSNRSLTKSTGSLYVKSSDASYFGAQHQQQQPPPPSTTHGTPSGRARESNSSGGSSSGSLYRPDSAQSWRTSSKDTPSLEKLRSSSIPISAAKSPAAAAAVSSKTFMASSAAVSPSMIPAGPSGAGYGVTGGSTVTSSSPQPRTKRDSLTTKVKNCDSLSRWQQQVVATSNSGGSGVVGNKGTPGAVSGASVSVVVGAAAATVSGGSHHPPPPVRERKQSGGGSVAVGGGLMMRHSSSGTTTGSSVGSGSQIAAAATDASNGNSSNSSSSVQQPNTNSVVAPAATGDTIKARRSNTFRVPKPTVLVPLLPPAVAAEQDCRYLMPEIGADAARPLRGIVGGPDGPEASGLIGEYLAAKTRGITVHHHHQQQQSPQSQGQALVASPPPIFHVTGRAVPAVNGAAQRQILEFAYKHPILLLDDDGNDDHGKADDHVPDDGTVEESTAATAQESLIIPHLTGGPTEMRWATPPQRPLPADSGTETAIAATGSGLVGKVNRNILKTWEQLRWACGGLASETKRDDGAPVSGEPNTAQQQQQQQAYPVPFRSNGIDQSGGDSDGGDSSTERQSCVLYCPQQHQHHLLSEELIDFKVNRLLHSPAYGGSTDRLSSTGSFSIMVAASTNTTSIAAVTNATAGGSSGVVRTTAGSSSEGGEFYDSIDAVAELKTKDRADLLEAFLGAMYVDRGLKHCEVFCQVCLFPRLQDFIMNQDWNDPKSKLQQCCLTLRTMDGGEPDIPVYKVIECTGPTNTRVYSVAVYFRGTRLACANGHSIQQAEMNAAQEALEKSKDLFPQLDHQKRVIAQSLKRQKVPQPNRSTGGDRGCSTSGTMGSEKDVGTGGVERQTRAASDSSAVAYDDPATTGIATTNRGSEKCKKASAIFAPPDAGRLPKQYQINRSTQSDSSDSSSDDSSSGIGSPVKCNSVKRRRSPDLDDKDTERDQCEGILEPFSISEPQQLVAKDGTKATVDIDGCSSVSDDEEFGLEGISDSEEQPDQLCSAVTDSPHHSPQPCSSQRSGLRISVTDFAIEGTDPLSSDTEVDNVD